MYGLLGRIDPSVFVGRCLEQVSFTANTVTLSFDRNIAITVESSFGVAERATVLQAGVGVPPGDTGILQLLGATVVSAEIEGAGNLILNFSSQKSFACFEDSDMYESYRITIDGKEIVV